MSQRYYDQSFLLYTRNVVVSTLSQARMFFTTMAFPITYCDCAQGLSFIYVQSRPCTVFWRLQFIRDILVRLYGKTNIDIVQTAGGRGIRKKTEDDVDLHSSSRGITPLLAPFFTAVCSALIDFHSTVLTT